MAIEFRPSPKLPLAQSASAARMRQSKEQAQSKKIPQKIIQQKSHEAPPKPVQKEKDGSRTTSAFETATKKRVTIWLDKDVILALKEQGQGWQPRLNDVLRKALGLHGE